MIRMIQKFHKAESEVECVQKWKERKYRDNFEVYWIKCFETIVNRHHYHHHRYHHQRRHDDDDDSLTDSPRYASNRPPYYRNPCDKENNKTAQTALSYAP